MHKTKTYFLRPIVIATIYFLLCLKTLASFVSTWFLLVSCKNLVRVPNDARFTMQASYFATIMTNLLFGKVRRIELVITVLFENFPYHGFKRDKVFPHFYRIGIVPRLFHRMNKVIDVPSNGVLLQRLKGSEKTKFTNVRIRAVGRLVSHPDVSSIGLPSTLNNFAVLFRVNFRIILLNTHCFGMSVRKTTFHCRIEFIWDALAINVAVHDAMLCNYCTFRSVPRVAYYRCL